MSKRSRLATVALTLGAPLAVVGGLMAASIYFDGSSTADRTATDLAMPLGLLWLASIVSITWFVLNRQWLASFASLALFLSLSIVGNRDIAERFIGQTEMPEQHVTATNETPYRAAIVLGGSTAVNAYGTTEINRSGERILSAAQLWHAGLVSAIICTGSTPNDDGNPHELGRELLKSVGVPEDVIYQVEGENTSQEMQNLRNFFDDLPAGFPEAGDFALITSAFHMPRAMRLAATQELEFAPIPVGYHASKVDRYEVRRVIPNADALNDFTIAMKEHLAALVGR